MTRPMLLPVGERIERKVIYQKVVPVREKTITTYTTTKWCGCKPVTKRYLVVRAEPVGEFCGTTKVIHDKTMWMPAGERVTTVKVIQHKTTWRPVGEQFTFTKFGHHRLGHHKMMHKAVGERFTTTKLHGKAVKPVGERGTLLKKGEKPCSSCK